MLPRFTVTQLEDSEGFWRARVSVNGDSIEVDRKHGSWRVTPAEGEVIAQGVPYALAVKLQEKVRPRERQQKIKRGDR